MKQTGQGIMAMPEPMTFMAALKAFFEAVHSIWKNGALLLWSCAAAAAALVVLKYADQWNVGGAYELNRNYGVAHVSRREERASCTGASIVSRRRGRAMKPPIFSARPVTSSGKTSRFAWDRVGLPGSPMAFRRS
jgi:hypothetical protein